MQADSGSDKLQNILIGLLVMGLIGLIAVFIWKKVNPQQATIKVEANRPSTVYVDNQMFGKIPYIAKTKKTKVKVRIIPDDVSLQSFETEIEALSNKQSLLKVYLAQDMTQASSVLAYPQRIGGETSELSFVTLPQTAQVRVDGQIRGFSPLKFTTTTGKHNVEISFEGYKNEVYEIEAYPGYRMVSVISLGKDGSFQSATPTPTPEMLPEEEKAKKVEILDTPTGFLRVRSQPVSSSAELGQVSPGEKFEYLESNEDKSWHKIIYTTSEGWVSATYTKIIEE